MENPLQGNLRAGGHMIRVTFARGTVLGLIGGLVGTIVMDIVCVGALLVMGLPAVVSFSTIGDTAAGPHRRTSVCFRTGPERSLYDKSSKFHKS